MGKHKRKRDEKESCENQDVQNILNSVLEFDGPSTSREAEQLPKRRDAIDQRNAALISADNSISNVDPTSTKSTRSVGMQTEFTSKQISIELNDFIDFKNEIKEMVCAVKTDMKKLQRSVIYDVKQIKDDVGFSLNSRNNSDSILDIKRKLNIVEPIQTLEGFKEFDQKIYSDKTHADGLRAILEFKTRAKSMSEAIGSCVGVIMAPELQLLYSGCGKPNKGVSKENFSATKTYAELKEYLMKQFPTEKESDILSKTSRWFANAKDRQHGRRFR